MGSGLFRAHGRSLRSRLSVSDHPCAKRNLLLSSESPVRRRQHLSKLLPKPDLANPTSAFPLFRVEAEEADPSYNPDYDSDTDGDIDTFDIDNCHRPWSNCTCRGTMD